MQTLGRRHGKRRTFGDYRTSCDECGAEDLRSKLIRMQDGLLYHRHGGCKPRHVAVELDKLNAAGATARRAPYRRDGGNT